MKSRLLVLLLLPLWLWPVFLIAHEARWEQHMRAGAAAYQRGDDEEAVEQTKAALKEAEDFGEQDPRLATTLNNLATLYESLGRHGKAEPLYKRSLAIAEKALRPEHPDLAAILNNLAELYQAQGRIGEAEPLFKRALAIWAQALRPEHPYVDIALNNLAALYRAQGRNEDAERLLREHGQ
jgi:tetratricopeptide (TPR) repeat protein